MTEQVRVVTMYGDIVVPCEINANFKEMLGRINEENAFRLFDGTVTINTIVAGHPSPKPREIKIGYATYNDITGIMEQNKLYDDKHQVDINTLEIWRITIDREYLRIDWTFNDDPEDEKSRRIIRGNTNEVHDARNGLVAFPVQTLQICW